MEFGLFSNGQRYNTVAMTTYEQDIEEIILADELGLREAWISEHGTFVSYQAPDQLPCADLLICKAAALTKNIRMGPGIRPLPYFHPLQVATDCAVCDHLTNGRYLAGFGLGIGGIGEPRGKMPGPLREISHEAIDLILKAWTSTEPFDWNGKYWQGKQWQIIPKPLSKPHMDVGIACTNSDSTLAIAAEKGFLPLFTWTQTPDKTAQMIKTYLETPSAAVKPDRSRARVARFVYVADSVDQARRDLHECDVGAAKLGRLDQYIPVGGTRADLTMERLMDQEVFCIGDPDSVTQQIRRLYHETGGFGVLLLVCGKEWGTWEQRQRSWRMFMRDVAPRLGDLDGNRPAH